MTITKLLEHIRNDSCFVNSCKEGPPSFEAYMGAIARIVNNDSQECLRLLTSAVIDAT